MAEMQVIPARHGTATFVPAGQVIKIVNSSGSQVVDTWAFALPKPEPKNAAEQDDEKEDANQDKASAAQSNSQKTQAKSRTKTADLPSQEDAEKATKQGWKDGEDAVATEKKSTWGSYVPSSIWPLGKKDGEKDNVKNASQDSEQKQNSRTWASYFPSGKGFSNYIPESARKTAGDTVSGLTAMHKRNPSKTYMEQLQDFSRTPVGAAGWSGLAALTGSGWGGSGFAAYQAWNAQNAANAAPMEFMSMPHTRAATLHLRPQVNDTLVSNFREPILTLIEDTSGIHDTLIAACDPARYKGLGVENWEEHGSCAENLVLALEELNKRAGLKGAKGVGADVTINSVPAPLNLFMNIPWDEQGSIGFHAPKCKKNDYVRLKAERDVVIVMSACPQDILDINTKKPTDAHFVVEEEEEAAPALKRAQMRKRPPPRKITSSHATSTAGTDTAAPAYKNTQQRRSMPQKRPAPPTAQKPAATTQRARKKPVPPAVAPQKKTNVASNAGPKDAPAAPAAIEKRKPRKLNPQPKE